MSPSFVAASLTPERGFADWRVAISFCWWAGRHVPQGVLGTLATHAGRVLPRSDDLARAFVGAAAGAGSPPAGAVDNFAAIGTAAVRLYVLATF